ncbi:MAG: ribonuclease E activity regulator RraA [Candidatus Marinimicrobia bacterium]|jgi:regulator of ribonuclease activity A|nr:ribonuclease E activity regulator RraA [Candidatus Neomarinimicrobiota bacterium]MBT5956420.1 ribonuclease E activity regulator RraA [Candidatus Neomarinimicrobiota bacterium]MBT6870440.1 ribonuclease E activity regulator RraA [Candidatus Neomarinimicrobiota bacterium]MBT7376842.1 ribonuclease E activity regulator RraA [Candidatus Neomarinimicrobiota bacterium]|tara:strand:- start:8406 stop:8900 length:495 start_codon:yes stop_codon:yes gene_type:complete
MDVIISTPDLSDKFDQQVQIVEPLFKHYGGLKQGFGKITTVECFEDNSLVAEQVKLQGKGGVLVVDGGESLRCSLLGDQLTAAAIDNGWSAILINGCLRDVEIIAPMQLVVMALASIPRKTVKAGKGRLNVPVSFAGVTFHPGHYLFADQTGILVSENNLLVNA